MISDVYDSLYSLRYRMGRELLSTNFWKMLLMSIVFPIKKRQKCWFVTLKLSSVKQIIINDRIRKLEIHQFYEHVHVPSCTLKDTSYCMRESPPPLYPSHIRAISKWYPSNIHWQFVSVHPIILGSNIRCPMLFKTNFRCKSTLNVGCRS